TGIIGRVGGEEFTVVLPGFDIADALQLAERMREAIANHAFPAVRIDGEPYWDGGIYSNTPVEVVLDDKPRHSSVIFSVQV
ncbi:patatin-like phospholipase family protein, partial [Paraburkholderia sp. BR14319]|uniref:GGDEF domain-containing protein n=1 Tax=Paraburkholderia sp. BR14319 TaxID=3237005 RepID=UPI0034D3821C